MSKIDKFKQIKNLLLNELAELDARVRNEDSEYFDSEYTSLDGNGVNCSEADAAIRPIAKRILEIIDGE